VTLRVKPSGTKAGNWIRQWEYAMAKGERFGILQLINGQWLRDLATAIRPLSEVLYDRYMNQADDPEQSTGTEYIEVGKKLRQALDCPQKVVRTTRGGAFAADFEGAEEAPVTDSSQRKERGKPTRGRKRARTSSIEEETSSSKKSKSQCLACGFSGHTLPECWCIFEDKRPEGCTIYESRLKRALKTVKDSKELTELVRKLKLEAEKEDTA
jgi:hypothetical protein